MEAAAAVAIGAAALAAAAVTDAVVRRDPMVSIGNDQQVKDGSESLHLETPIHRHVAVVVDAVVDVAYGRVVVVDAAAAAGHLVLQNTEFHSAIYYFAVVDAAAVVVAVDIGIADRYR